MHHSVFNTNNICSAVFALAINRLHSFKRQPFWFHNLNSMVPVKGIVLFNLVFLSHLFFSFRGWSDGAMVLGKLPVPGRPTIWMIVR